MESINNNLKSSIEFEKLSILECIRGVAALAVCLYHFQAANIKFIGTSIFLKDAFYLGSMGVQAFFVVSGFIIPYSLIKSKYNITDFFRFFLKRCIRIEIPYLLSIVLVIGLTYLATRSSAFLGNTFSISWQQVLLHVGYLPKHFGYNWLQEPYWTLEAEFHYYILIGIFLPLIWKNQLFFTVGMVLALISSFHSSLLVFDFMPFFVFGIATCAFKLKKIHVITFLGLLLLSFFVCFLKGFPIAYAYIAMLTALLICYGKFESKLTNFLGKISFSLYLLHVPIGGKVINLLGRFADSSFQVWMVYLLALGLTISAAYFFNRLVEMPSMMLSKRIVYSSQKKII